MNLEYLKTFYTTVKENSISKTAKLLHMSQPGVSVQLQALEKELGFQLLVRSNKGVILTDAGKIVYDYAVSLLSIKKDIERDLDSLRTSVQEMVVSSCTTVGSYALPCSLYLFKKKYPNVKLLLDICNSQTVITNLLNNSAPIGIVQGCVNNNRIKFTEITKSSMVLVCSKKICKYKRVSLKELSQLPMIVREKGSGTRCDLECNLEHLNMSLDEMNIILELTSTESIKSAIFAGRGYSILPELTIKNELMSGALNSIEIEDIQLESHYYIAHLKEKTPRGAEKDFYEFLRSTRRGFC